MNIGAKQIEIIENAKVFLKKIQFSKIDTALSSFCYFTSWTETPGYARLKLKANGWIYSFNFFFIMLKNILAISSHAEYFEFSKQREPRKSESLIITWAYQNNFQEDGSFQDRYFNENSKNIPNSYWLLISMDGYIPPKLNGNIKIFLKKKNFFKYNFLPFIKILFSIIIDCNLSPKKIFHYLNFHSFFAKIILPIVKKEVKNNNFKFILMPYEAQPFQNKIFSEVKKFNSTIKNVGYLHSLSPLTTELIYREGAPDLLLVHSESQHKTLQSYLGWPTNNLFLIKSLRFTLKNKESLSKKIFLPNSLHDSDILIKEFRNFIKNSPEKSFPKFNIKIHPSTYNYKKQKRFEKNIEIVMDRFKDRFSDNSIDKNISIFFGVTAAILEALEKGSRVIHICSDPVFQSYSEDLWPNLKVKKITHFIYEYNIISLGKTINLDQNANLIDELKKLNILLTG